MSSPPPDELAAPSRTGTLIARSSATSELDVEVSSIDGIGIAGAAVFLIGRDNAPRRFGHTDGHGLISIPRPEADAYVAAVRDGYASSGVLWKASSGPVTTIRLEREARISGTCQLADGSPAPDGVAVIAYNSSSRFPHHELTTRAFRGDPRVGVSSTDSSGSFSIGGLDPRFRYSVSAGGGALVACSVAERVAPNTDDLVLTLDEAYAVIVRVREPGGSPLMLSRSLEFGPETSISSLAHGTRLSILPGWTIGLVGVSPDSLDLGPLDIVLIGTERGGGPITGPFEYRISVPGYRETAAQFSMQRLSAGLESEVIEIQRDSTDYGTVLIQLPKDWPVDLGASFRRRPLAALVLSGSDGRVFRYGVRDLSPGEVRLEPVPIGDYRCHFDLPLSGHAQDQWISVNSDRDCSFSLDARSIGGIEASVERPSGSPYLGPLVVVLGRSDDARSFLEVDFQRAPYVLSGLRSGRYWVALRSPKATSSAEGLRVDRGAVASASFVLDE